MLKIENAAIMLIVNRQNKILAVSRKSDSTKFCLPGGKQEPNEPLDRAAIRETQEETNLTVKKCMLLYQSSNYESEKEKYYNTTCFLAEEWDGNIHSNEGLIIKWLTPEELVSKESGAYPEYNSNVIKAYNALQILF